MQKIKIVALVLSLVTTRPSLCMEDDLDSNNKSALDAAIALFKHSHREICSTKLVLDAQEGDLEAVRILIPVSNVNARIGDTRATALLVASQNGHEEIVTLLLQAKALPDITDIEGRSPLQQASQNGHLNIVQLLLQNGGEKMVNAKDKLGLSPLRQASGNGKNAVVLALLAANADIEILDNRNFSVFTLACENGHLGTADLLLKNGARTLINFPSKEGATPLRQASQNGHAKVVEFLLQNGAEQSINMREELGSTPVWVASKNGHDKIVALLTKAKADVTIPDISGFSPLHAAAELGRLAVIKQLIEADPDMVVARNRLGSTPLHVASYHNQYHAAALLLINDADTTIRNAIGQLAVDFARSKEMRELFELYMSNKPGKKLIASASRERVVRECDMVDEQDEDPAGPEEQKE